MTATMDDLETISPIHGTATFLSLPIGLRDSIYSLILTVTGEIGFSPKINVFKLNSRFWTH
jgi:hypothetical protein